MIDLRTIRAARPRRTLVIGHQDPPRRHRRGRLAVLRLSAGIADRITQRIFDELDAPIRRVATKDAPIPYNKALENSMLPSVDRVITAVHDVLYI